MPERLVVVGGDAAGMSAASQARRGLPADRLRITAFEQGRFTSYSACGIPYWIGGQVDDREDLIARTPEAFRRDHDIDVALHHRVVGIDTRRGTVRVRDLEAGTERDEGYDHLMIATGAVPAHPDLDGIGAQGIHGVQTLEDGDRLLRTLRSRRPRTAVVVGAGYIGLEMAEALVQRGLDVTMVEAAPQPMSTLDPDLGALVADAITDLSIDLRLGAGVTAFEHTDGRVSAVVVDGLAVPADLVVLGLGARPAVAVAAEAGVPVGDAGGLVTDPQQRTPVERVWAAGDCVEVFHRVSRRRTTVALGTHANKQGRVAGTNIAGGYATFPGVVGTAATKVCGLEVARTGLNAAEIDQAGLRSVSTTVTSSTRAGYYPGAREVTVKVHAERGTGRLLGAQVVGEDGAAKRIDVFATALWTGLTVGELAYVDLSYAPPFSPTWDPVLIAARKAADAVDAARD